MTKVTGLLLLKLVNICSEIWFWFSLIDQHWFCEFINAKGKDKSGIISLNSLIEIG